MIITSKWEDEKRIFYNQLRKHILSINITSDRFFSVLSVDFGINDTLYTQLYTYFHSINYIFFLDGPVVVVIVLYLYLQLPVQSVPTTTKALSSNPAHGEVYSIQHYVIKFISKLPQVGGFLRVLPLPPPIKLTATIYNPNP